MSVTRHVRRSPPAPPAGVHAGQQRRQLAEARPPSGAVAVDAPRRGRRTAASSATSATSSTGATQVSAPASSSTHSSRVRRGERRRRTRPGSASWAASSTASDASSGQPSAGTGWRRTSPRWPPRPATSRRRLVGAVAGVPAGEDVVARADVGPGGQLLVDGQRRQPQHAVGDGHVEVGALARRRPAGQGGRDGQRRLHAAGGGVGDGGARQRRRAVRARRAHGQEAADGQVVDVVARPTARAGRPGRSRWSSSRRCPGCAPDTAS